VACGEGLSCSLRAKIRESLNGKAFSGESSLYWLLRAFREVDCPTDFVAFGQARLPKKGLGPSSVVIKQVPGGVRHCCETLRLLDSEDAVLRKIFSLDFISFASSFAARSRI
jgi:hypothetical protein